MVSPHRPLDPRSGLVIDTHDLGRGAGAMKLLRPYRRSSGGTRHRRDRGAPGSPLELDLLLEAVVEGVLVSGTARARCSESAFGAWLCLRRDRRRGAGAVRAYRAGVEPDEEARRLDGDLLDLEPLLRDAIVVELPFQPLCWDDCHGLCAECGADLNVEPAHRHAAAIDPRWVASRRLEGRPAILRCRTDSNTCNELRLEES